jgi:hypothetical protein
MDTTSKFSSEKVGEVPEEINVEGSGNVEEKGFLGMLAQSIFEVCQFEWVSTNYLARSQQCRRTRHERFLLPIAHCPIRTSILDKLEFPRPHDAGSLGIIVGVYDLVSCL